jgi:hypothetical protein
MDTDIKEVGLTVACFKLYDGQHNTQVSWVWCQRLGTDTKPRRLKSCTPASEDGLKESPKHVRQK